MCVCVCMCVTLLASAATKIILLQGVMLAGERILKCNSSILNMTKYSRGKFHGLYSSLKAP